MERLEIDPDRPDMKKLEIAAQTILDGGIVIYPTDTAYGIGADILNPSAIEKLNSAKKRPSEKQYTAIVNDLQKAERFCVLNDLERKLIAKFMPGPLTLAVDKKDIVPSIIQSCDFAFRIPDSYISKEIPRLSNTAITATSANISGEMTPYSISDINPDLLSKVDIVIDAGILPKRPTSTICKIYPDKRIKVFRKGAIDISDIEKCIQY